MSCHVMGQVMSCHDMLMPAVIETCTRLKLPMQILDNSANYGLKCMADDRVDMSTILQKEHATWNATMTVTMTMLMIMTMTMTMTMTMNMTITMTMDMTTFAICHCHSLVIWWGRMDVGWYPFIVPNQ